MVRHVLIPLDGSQLAEKALPIARHVIQTGTRITLLTAIPSPTPPIYAYPSADVLHEIEEDSHYLEKAKPSAQAYLERVAHNLRLQGYTVEIKLTPGDPAESIIQVAEQLRVDMIVISTHGRSGLSRFLFGSVTLKVLQASAVPVLVVPNREREEAEDTEPASTTGHSLAT